MQQPTPADLVYQDETKAEDNFPLSYGTLRKIYYLTYTFTAWLLFDILLHEKQVPRWP